MSDARWYLLIHQLPPEPLYLRAKIRQRLARVGAVALKNAVYVLPHREDCLEDFEWIAQEAVAGGGEAYVCEADFVEKENKEALIERFREERDADYEALAEAICQWNKKAERRSSANPPEEDLPHQFARARKRFDEITRIDFFKAKRRKEIEALLEGLERQLQAREDSRAGAPKSGKAELIGRTWVTRRSVQVDRIASAWLIRRFLDPSARFRFVDPKERDVRPGEVRFDMVGGEFTHEGDRCTFETLIHRTGVKDPALGDVAQIVHDIDLKDGKFGRADARGIEQILTGLLLAHADDEGRLDRGFALFDELYESFRRKKPAFQKEVKR